MTSNGKQFTVTREMLTAVARDGWNLSMVFKFCFCFVFLLYNKSLGEQKGGEGGGGEQKGGEGEGVSKSTSSKLFL